MPKLQIEISDEVKTILEDVRKATGAVSIERVAEELVRDAAMASKAKNKSEKDDALKRIHGTINSLANPMGDNDG